MNVDAEIEKLLAGRWIAGYYAQDAIERTRIFNSHGISTLINFLGEELFDPTKVEKTVSTYVNLIKAIKKNKLDASISLKPTQIGLNISYKLMLSNYLKIAKTAKQNGVFLWLDMEAQDKIDDTIKAYKNAIKYQNTGICIQSYLKRSEADIDDLMSQKAKIRLVKGAYTAKLDTIFKSRREISRNYTHLMKKLFVKSDNFMIATHDSRIIEDAIRINKRYSKHITYAMLNGIRNKYAVYLAKHHQKVAIYVPFGKDWINFAYRRLLEQKHITLIVRSLLEKQEI